MEAVGISYLIALLNQILVWNEFTKGICRKLLEMVFIDCETSRNNKKYTRNYNLNAQMLFHYNMKSTYLIGLFPFQEHPRVLD